MSKRATDEVWRKPRVAFGTPLSKFSSLFAVGVISAAGLIWYLYEHWTASKKLKQDIVDGKFESSPGMKFRIDSMRYSKQDPVYHELIIKMQERAYEREQTVRKQPWYVKMLASTPEV